MALSVLQEGPISNLPEVLRRLWRDVVVKLEVDPAQWLPVHRHIHEAQFSRICQK